VSPAAIAIHRYAPTDVSILTPAVEQARAASEFRGSSDKDGGFFLRLLEMAHNPVALAIDGAGAVAGFASPDVKIAWVRPELRRQGIGRRLIDACVEIERERGRPEVLMGLDPLDGGGRAFLEATAFAYHSTLWDLALPRDAAVRPPAWPAGIEARPLDWDRDKRAWQQLFNAAFADHATPLQIDESIGEQAHDLPWKEEDLLVLDEGGELVGFSATEPQRDDDGVVGPRGEIWTIGVRPDRQGHGLGRQLLRWGVGHLRGLGVETVTLAVNALNPGALGLYESEGFVRTSTRERWARQVPDAE